MTLLASWRHLLRRSSCHSWQHSFEYLPKSNWYELMLRLVWLMNPTLYGPMKDMLTCLLLQLYNAVPHRRKRRQDGRRFASSTCSVAQVGFASGMTRSLVLYTSRMNSAVTEVSSAIHRGSSWQVTTLNALLLAGSCLTAVLLPSKLPDRTEFTSKRRMMCPFTLPMSRKSRRGQRKFVRPSWWPTMTYQRCVSPTPSSHPIWRWDYFTYRQWPVRSTPLCSRPDSL